MTHTTHHDCPRCGGYPELDEDGHVYTCYFCCDTGMVPEAVAAEYWQGLADEREYQRMRPVVDGKHQGTDGDEEYSYTLRIPLLAHPALKTVRTVVVEQWMLEEQAAYEQRQRELALLPVLEELLPAPAPALAWDGDEDIPF